MSKTFSYLPTNCPACKSTLQWDANEVHIVCKSTTCSAQNSKGILNFFTTLKVKNVSMGTVTRLIEEGYNSIDAILRLDEYDVSIIEGLGKTKAKQIVQGLKDAITDVDLAVIQNATNIFEGFGERRLRLFSDTYEECTDPNANLNINALVLIPGVSEITI